MSEPTKTPWEICGASIIWSPSGKATVAAVSEPRGANTVQYVPLELGSPDFEEACANAAHIVRCVNSFEGLVTALKHAMDLIKDQPDASNIIRELNAEVYEEGRAAIAAAKGQR